MTFRTAVPWALVALRALSGPAIVVGAQFGLANSWLSVVVVAGLLSDIYDGVLARRWGCETSLLRLLDSLADTVFYIGVTCILWIREPQALRGSWKLFTALFALEALRYAFDLAKFGKAASYHSYLAKVWGLVIVTAVVGSLNNARFQVLIPVAVIVGIIVNVEGFAMSATLPRWTHDVKTIKKARALRRAMLNDRD